MVGQVQKQQLLRKVIMESKMYYRAKDLAKYLSIGESTIWHKVKDGQFPKPTLVSPNIAVWNIVEINEFIASKKGTGVDESNNKED